MFQENQTRIVNRFHKAQYTEIPVSPGVDFRSLLKEHHPQASHYYKDDTVVEILCQSKMPQLLYHSRTCTFKDKNHIFKVKMKKKNGIAID